MVQDAILPLPDTQCGVHVCDVMGHGVRSDLLDMARKIRLTKAVDEARDLHDETGSVHQKSFRRDTRGERVGRAYLIAFIGG